MRNPSPHNTSYLYNPIFSEQPYNNWIKYAKSIDEIDNLLQTFSFIPIDWVYWVENIFEQNIKNGNVVSNPLYYRLGILWNGIILMQETKYICDVLENSLRQIYITEIRNNNLTYSQIKNNMHEWNRLVVTFERATKTKILLENQVETSFVLLLTFRQLTESIVKRWITISQKPYIKGFGKFFYNNSSCRDFNVFIKDMNYVRNTRNTIAHSNKLFTNEETQQIYRIASKWLSPLEIKLSQKVLSYRDKRPMFLNDLILIENNNYTKKTI